MKIRLILTVCALAAAAASASAQTLKPGLWEMTNKVGANPEMDKAMAQMQQQMASMPPAQRKQMEEMMAKQGVQMGSAGGGMSVKVCFTKEMVERNDIAGAQQGDCKTTAHPRVGNTMKMNFVCANPPSTGEGEVTFMGTDGFHSKMKVTSSPRGKPETMTTEGSGKWLGADCGSVKPIVVPKK